MPKTPPETDAEKQARVRRISRQIDEFLEDKAAKPHPQQELPRGTPY
ncbi:MAG TPA: hypothetical protein VGW38_06195 [Chloroflexota bacterium]|nr:hypothetical protein [Chloroflexota bacterium]